MPGQHRGIRLYAESKDTERFRGIIDVPVQPRSECSHTDTMVWDCLGKPLSPRAERA